jgi:hypothetical protein
MNKIPNDIWDIIGLYTRNYNDYLSLCEVIKGLGTPQRLRNARNKFTVCTMAFGKINQSREYGYSVERWHLRLSDTKKVLHREDDLPAYVKKEFHTTLSKWYFFGKIHRNNDKPAYIAKNADEPDGYCRRWYRHGKRHRENDKPAYINYHSYDGAKEKWYVNDKLHRDGDKPAKIVMAYDTNIVVAQYWYKHGVRHRHIGPALIYSLGKGK